MESVLRCFQNEPTRLQWCGGGAGTACRNNLNLTFFKKNSVLSLFISCQGWWAAAIVHDWSTEPCVWAAVSPGTGSPGTWGRRWATCLRSWWTCPGWLASRSASSPCWTAPACWPRQASSCASPAAEQRRRATVALVRRQAAARETRVWQRRNKRRLSDFRGLWLTTPLLAHRSPMSFSSSRPLELCEPGGWHTLIRSQEDHLLPGNGLTLQESRRTLSYAGNLNSYEKKKYHFLFDGTNLQCRSLIFQTVEDAAAAAYEVIHVSVSVVQVGVELQSLVYGNRRVCILEMWQMDSDFGGGQVYLKCDEVRNRAVHSRWWWRFDSRVPLSPSPGPLWRSAGAENFAEHCEGVGRRILVGPLAWKWMKERLSSYNNY